MSFNYWNLFLLLLLQTKCKLVCAFFKLHHDLKEEEALYRVIMGLSLLDYCSIDHSHGGLHLENQV